MSDNRQDLLNMLCDLSDLSALVTGSENIENILQRTVALVSGHLRTPVCSIYFTMRRPTNWCSRPRLG